MLADGAAESFSSRVDSCPLRVFGTAYIGVSGINEKPRWEAGLQDSRCRGFQRLPILRQQIHFRQNPLGIPVSMVR